MPKQTPALEDERLNAFLDDLVDKASSIDYSKHKEIPEGKARLVISACEQAMDVDTTDPYATYAAAEKLAKAYDNVMAILR